MKNNREKGNIGEDIACNYLAEQGFFVQERNYLKKWGEIDIIAVKDGILHFIEVKSIMDNNVSKGYRPEENVHDLKIKRLRRTIQTFLNERKYNFDLEFKFHIITVLINKSNEKHTINMLENIIL